MQVVADVLPNADANVVGIIVVPAEKVQRNHMGEVETRQTCEA